MTQGRKLVRKYEPLTPEAEKELARFEYGMYRARRDAEKRAEDVARVKHNPEHILEMPKNRVDSEILCVAFEKEGDYKIFKAILKNFPKLVDENFCKVAVSAPTKKKFVGYEDVKEPWGIDRYPVYEELDPILKYVPEKLRTFAVCSAAVGANLKSLEFVPVKILIEHPELCTAETFIYKSTEMWGILEPMPAEFFEHYPYQLEGRYTLRKLSAAYQESHLDVVRQILDKEPRLIGLVAQSVRTAHPDIVRDALDKDIYGVKDLTLEEQQAFIDYCQKLVMKYPDELREFDSKIQKALTDECIMESVMKSGDIKPLPKRIMRKHPDYLERLVSKYPEKLGQIPEDILVAHPEICVAAINANVSAAFPILEKKDILYGNINLCRLVLEKKPSYIGDFRLAVKTQELCDYAMELDAVNVMRVPEIYVTKEKWIGAVLREPHLLRYLPPKYRRYLTADLCEQLVVKDGKNGEVFQDVPLKIRRENPNLCKLAVGLNPYNIIYVPKSVQMKRPDICQLAYRMVADNDTTDGILECMSEPVLKQHWDLIVNTDTISPYNKKEPILSIYDAWASENDRIMQWYKKCLPGEDPKKHASMLEDFAKRKKLGRYR